MQLDLLGMKRPAREWETFALPDAEVRLLHGFIDESEATRLLGSLTATVRWRSDTIVVYGKEHPLPRLQQWFGEPGLVYRWSGIAMSPEPWNDELIALKERVDDEAKSSFNTALLNLYRNGSDAVSWHADDERELGPAPIIASVSLGAERDFVMRHRHRSDVPTHTIRLPHGSLLVMSGPTQENWVHAVPRRRRIRDVRLNLTFRRVGHGLSTGAVVGRS